MTLPEQHPVPAPRYRFRPRSDRYSLPTFRDAERREYVAPIETYDPRNEVRPFSWSELRDPQVWLGGGLLFAVMVLLLIVFLASLADVTP